MFDGIKIISCAPRFFICLAAAFSVSCNSTSASESDTMCDALNAFALSIPDSETYSITLRTEWADEPLIACGARAEGPDRTFCDYLVNNSSIEFMAVNIRRVLECVGTDYPTGNLRPNSDGVKGTVVSHDPQFTNEKVDVEVTFDTLTEPELPILKIAITRQN